MAGAAHAKTPKNAFVFRLPAPIRPETVQVRYLLTGKFGGVAGWRSFEHEGSVAIVTDYGRTPAAGMKAVVFTPSCEPERVVVDDLKASSREHALPCRPAPVIQFRGQFARPSEWRALRVQVNVEYLAPWVNQFFGLDRDDLVAVSVADVPADAAGQFQFPIPVIGQDGKAPDGGFSFVLREATSGNVLGILQPPAAFQSPHGLKPSPEYPAVVEFGLQRNR